MESRKFILRAFLALGFFGFMLIGGKSIFGFVNMMFSACFLGLSISSYMKKKDKLPCEDKK